MERFASLKSKVKSQKSKVLFFLTYDSRLSTLDFFFFLFIFAFCVLPFTFIHAQVPGSIDGIDITISPQNPVPGKNVDISMQDYLTDISSANISWVVDGVKVASGVGKSEIVLTAPPLGKKNSVIILIHTENGKDIQKSLTIKSGSVDLIWESGGYAPPLYGGKQDFAFENTVKIIAMPHLSDSSGTEIDPSTLIYNWSQDSTAMPDQSGYGRQAIVITGSVIPRPTTINVTVSTRDGSLTASGVITMEAGNPSIVFYKDDPLYGVLYNMALKAQTVLSNQEITLLAAPFSFTVPSLSNNSLQYNWTINGTDQSGFMKNRSVTLRVQDTSKDATYPVQLQLQNMNEILEGATNAITIMFAANKNNNAISL